MAETSRPPVAGRLDAEQGGMSRPGGVAYAGSPTEISGAGWLATFKRARTKAKQDRVPMMAGSIAYHGFLTVFPLLIALVGIAQFVGLSPSTISTLIRGIGKTLPQGASGVLTTALQTAHRRTTGTLTVTVIAIVVALWSASGGMSVVETGLDVAYELPTDRTFVAKRIRGLVLLLFVVLLGGAASALVVFAKPLGREIEQVSPVTGVAFDVPWTIVRWVVTVLLMVTLFSVLYWFGPNRKPLPWRWISPGGLLATAIWLLASFGLSFYVSALGSYGKTYGALSGVVVFLLWFYLTGLAVLFGGQINAELERQAKLEADRPGQRGRHSRR